MFFFNTVKRKTQRYSLRKGYTRIVEASHKGFSKKTSSLLVLFDGNCQRDATLQKLSDIFNLEVANITCLVFNNKVPNTENIAQVVCPEDFGFFGKLCSEDIRAILTNTYDVLINYSKEDNLYTNLLLLNAKALFRIGFSDRYREMYHLTILDKSGNCEVMNEAVEKYIRILDKQS